MSADRMRVGLVLGGGGVKGAAYHTGALGAIVEATGWNPSRAEYIVGTSAGSIIGSLLAAGVTPAMMAAHAAGQGFPGVDGDGEQPVAEPGDPSLGYQLYLRGWPSLALGSPRLALTTLRNPRGFTPGALAAGWLPKGPLSTEPIRRIIHRAVPEGWADHPNVWAIAVDYRTGGRVVFGQEGAPETDLATAVAASCAVPGYFRPVRIEGREYIDGGVYSVSNLDLLAGRGLDLVICINPMSSLFQTSHWTPRSRLLDFTRSMIGRRLGGEARQVRESGTPVLLIQAQEADLEAFGSSMMSRRNRRKTLEVARQTVAAQLQEPENGELLSILRGSPGRRRTPARPATAKSARAAGRT
jgi:NTE family protein